eukprot:scaffold23978_cov80-Skeletonema_marinoi.AAC.1
MQWTCCRYVTRPDACCVDEDCTNAPYPWTLEEDAALFFVASFLGHYFCMLKLGAPPMLANRRCMDKMGVLSEGPAKSLLAICTTDGFGLKRGYVWAFSER